VLCAKACQFALDQGQRGALLRIQRAGIDLFSPLQQAASFVIAALVVGGGFTEQHGIIQPLAGEHRRQGQFMALEGPIALGQCGQRLMGAWLDLNGHERSSEGEPQIASRITAIVQSGNS
jgi:cobyrinic acid a,c-diamide synthase